MKFSNMQVGDLGAGGIVFPQGVIVDISSYSLTPDQVRSLSASVADGTLRAEDAEAQQLTGLTATPNAQFYLPPGVVGGSGGTGSSSTIVTESLTGLKNGVNDTFTIPTVPTSWCAIYWGPTRLAEGVGFTRAGATVTMLPGHIPQSGDQLYADHD
jgi:hypothetical protein